MAWGTHKLDSRGGALDVLPDARAIQCRPFHWSLGMLPPRNEHFFLALLPRPLKTTKLGTLGSESCLVSSASHSLHVRLLLLHTLSLKDGLGGMARERRQGSLTEETSWGHLEHTQGRELSKAVNGGPRSWEWMELHGGCRLRQGPVKG